MAGMAHKRYSIAMRQVDQDLFDACEDGDLEKAKRSIEKGADINAKDNDGWTPLHYACGHNGNKAIASLLLENGANVDVKDYFNGWTPLHYARNEAIASLLLEKGADINAKSHDGLTPLQLASTKGHEAIALLFLEKGADVNSQDNNGETPLHNASANGHEAIVSLLLEKGANIEAKDEDGDTSLHDASSNGHKAIVSLLLENGADLTITNNNGKTPWQIAQSWNKQDCVAAIEKFLQQKEYSEKFETRAALDQELQQLQHVMDAARDSLDPNVFLAAASAKAEYEIIIPLRKWPQYMSVSELELEIARLEDKARGLKSGKERIKVFRKIVQLRKTLEPFVHDGMKTTLQLAQEQLFDEIRRTLTSNFIRDIVVTSCPTYNTISKLTKKIARLEEMVQGMDIGKERMDVFLERNKLKQRLQGEIQQETKTPLQLAKEKLPDDIQRIFICPISGDFMKDPVTLYPSGKTFDRESICTWLLRGTIPPRCPWTNKEVDRQIPYMENLDTRNFLIHYLGKEAYDRYDDETFKVRYEALWKAHNAESLFNKGVSYQDDDQFDVAAEYFEAAAAEGHAGAQYNLALLNEDNHERMLGFLQQAAAQDHPDALYDLGSLYFDSDIVPLDFNRAREYFQLAAAQGHNEALHFLGTLYSDSDHVPQDLNRAQEYFQQAAAEGHAGAQYNLAMLNKDNHERMLGYLEQAAGQDHLEALYYLGTLYYDSEVVPQDLNRARDYFQRAVDHGHSEAWKALESLPVKKARIS